MFKKSRSSESLPSFAGGKSCVCSPTKHPGSFRCRHHRQQTNQSIASATADSSPLKLEAIEGLASATP
ncbi:hypothetical protein AXF42_Ash020555 [Apostasia shenzhenica]|uniref:Serine-rich protein-related n=1 Tax=Apostasia shenzhenica TaxID=1088818 RepID=A0A2I0BCW5_9ASPA|nr:hypothetical protein AXF42_Ash020555 [Apostasia shenzhenica]